MVHSIIAQSHHVFHLLSPVGLSNLCLDLILTVSICGFLFKIINTILPFHFFDSKSILEKKSKTFDSPSNATPVSPLFGNTNLVRLNC